MCVCTCVHVWVISVCDLLMLCMQIYYVRALVLFTCVHGRLCALAACLNAQKIMKL